MTRAPRSKLGVVDKVTVSLSPETSARLETYCQKNERPRSWVVEKALQTYFAKLEKGGRK